MYRIAILPTHLGLSIYLSLQSDLCVKRHPLGLSEFSPFLCVSTISDHISLSQTSIKLYSDHKQHFLLVRALEPIPSFGPLCQCPSQVPLLLSLPVYLPLSLSYPLSHTLSHSISSSLLSLFPPLPLPLFLVLSPSLSYPLSVLPPTGLRHGVPCWPVQSPSAAAEVSSVWEPWDSVGGWEREMNRIWAKTRPMHFLLEYVVLIM